jgi:hypothetical protein
MNHYLNECYESLKIRGKDKILDQMFDPIMDGMNNLIKQRTGNDEVCLKHPYCILATMDAVIYRLLMALNNYFVGNKDLSDKCAKASREKLRMILQEILDKIYIYEDIEKIKVLIPKK